MRYPHLHTIAILIAVGVAAPVFYVGYRAYEARYWITHWRQAPTGPVSFTIEPREVMPGGRLTLVASFSLAYDFGFATINDTVHVLDESGTDRLLTPDELQLASEPNAGFALPGDEGIGCLMLEPQTTPPRRYIEQVTIEAMPGTPAGQYVLRLEPHAFCNGLPNDSVELPFSVVDRPTT